MAHWTAFDLLLAASVHLWHAGDRRSARAIRNLAWGAEMDPSALYDLLTAPPPRLIRVLRKHKNLKPRRFPAAVKVRGDRFSFLDDLPASMTEEAREFAATYDTRRPRWTLWSAIAVGVLVGERSNNEDSLRFLAWLSNRVAGEAFGSFPDTPFFPVSALRDRLRSIGAR